jgi:hypothetical protein
MDTDWRAWAWKLAEALELTLSIDDDMPTAGDDLLRAETVLDHFHTETPCRHGFTKPTCGQCA